MSQRDYILRLAEEVGRALAQIIYHRERRDYQGALNFIDEQYKQTLGMGAGFIHSASEETLLAMLTSLGTLNTEKCWLLATLLKAEGEIYELQENENGSYYCYLKSINLFLEVLCVDKTLALSEPVAEIEGLLYKLEAYELPPHTKYLLFQYFERTGRFSKAEDMLFEIIEADQDDHQMIARGRAFYQRLMRKSDAALLAGNLSRAEVEEGQAKLRNKG